MGSMTSQHSVERVVDQVRRINATCAAPADRVIRTEVTATLTDVARVKAWLTAAEADLVRRLDGPGTFPEADIADATRCSLSDASKQRERSQTLDAADRFAASLGNGDITAGHVDALTRAGKKRDEPHRSELFDQQDDLVAHAESIDVAAFDRLLKRKVKEIQADDGIDRLHRQKRAVRLRSWVDDDGMWNLAGRYDPDTAKDLAQALRQATEATFAQQIPDGAPADPIERQQFLAAHALTDLMLGARANGTRSSTDALVVVDATQPDGAGGPVVDWGIPVEVPHHVLADLLGVKQPDVVIVANGIVLHAPGQLNLGRTTRLANRAQRRALRGLYSTCAIPGCGVHSDRCKLHHIIWWRHGGRTDLDNLLPVCARHHTKIHDHGWIVELGPHRQLTLRLPDGTIHNTGPPSRRAA